MIIVADGGAPVPSASLFIGNRMKKKVLS